MTMPDLPLLAPGTVWLAGAGPGDARHLTLWSWAGLQQADVVVHDALVDASVLALAQGTKLPVGKRGGQPSWKQDDIIAALIEHARAGKRVLRLKGGDPTIFGRGGEEALALAEAGIPFQMVPGVTAGLAALAEAHMPATLRGVNTAVVFATGHDDAALDWQALARLDQPVVFYMGFNQLPRLIARLRDAGMDSAMPAAALSAATLANAQVVTATLATLEAAVAQSPLPTPVLLVVGRIVQTRAQLLALLG